MKTCSDNLKIKTRILGYSSLAELMLSDLISFSIIGCGRVQCDSHWSLGPTVRDDHLIYFLEYGGISGKVNTMKMELKPYELLWLQPKTKFHFFISHQMKQTCVIYCRFKLWQKNSVRVLNDYIMAHGDTFYRDLLLSVTRLHAEDSKFSDIQKRSLMYALLFQILSQMKGKGKNSLGLKPNQKNLALCFIEENLQSRFSIKDIANHIKMNSHYFTSQFTKSFGISPQAWIKKERIRLAADMLSGSNLSVSEVAYHFGYQDVYFFSHQFKNVMGLSPDTWRKTR